MFDTAAPTYTQFSTAQQALFTRVLPTYPTRAPDQILDIGCGTGVNTLKLHSRYTQSIITGVDQSSQMIDQARKHAAPIRWQIASAETYTHPDRVDFISSHGTLHWLTGPIAPIIRKNLAPHGGFNIHMFGPETYTELHQALRICWPQRTPLPNTPFRTVDDYVRDLRPEFGPLVIDHTRLSVAYPSITDLLKTIKYTGTSMATARGLWTPRRLSALAETYCRHFGGIWATHSLISIRNYD
ncbi:MAG: methyltransferase domain-containing protein [Candidatus Marinamargulisbacteria bacterium]|jgi:malonyl-CoA O-methyltransferase|nr:methyltransferase domain-containing protein [Candidatus Marinamargulisbacteria bacterium]